MPVELDELVARMLAKEPAERPAHGQAVAAALASLARSSEDTLRRQRAAPVMLSLAERHLVSIVAADVPLDSAEVAAAAAPAPAEATHALHLAMQRVATRFEARVETLAGGGIVVMLVGTGHAVDRAALAARCALEIASAVPGKPIALVTGWGESRGALPVGEVLDRAALLLEGAAAVAQQDRPVAVCIDAATRALLDARFEVVEQSGLLLLCGEQTDSEPARLLLGKPSPFVGRERELRQLSDLAEDSLTEQRSVAILVTAPAGMGKSRLGREFVRSVQARHDALVIGMGRGDSIGAGSTFAMLAASLRSALGIPSGASVERQREALAQAVGQYLGHDDRQRMTEFLGELLGVPFPDENSPQLRAARRHAHGMAAQIEAACIALLRGLTAVRPVMLVLEDLHWGDAPSVRLLDTALRDLEDSALAVLALARPEVHERFPGLWGERHLQEIRLSALSRHAAARLVHNALGDALDVDQVAALVQRAGGNTFYLEELVRAAAADLGHGAPLPETVLGVVAERLTSLEPEVRRLLRAGSVFGERFCTGGALALLGSVEETHEVWLDVLADLVEREILLRVPRAEQRFASEDEHAFRHALIREATYAMLTERDRVAGHRRAGEWLLEAGEQEPLVLAEHFAQGGEGTRAAVFYQRAADQAFFAHDLANARLHADRGLALTPDPETRAALLVTLSGVRSFAGDAVSGYQDACQALELAAPGTPTHGRALSFAALLAVAMGQYDEVVRLSNIALALELADVEEGFLVDAFGALTVALIGAGMVDRAEVCLRRLEQITTSYSERDVAITARLESVRTQWERLVMRDPWAALQHGRTNIRCHELAGEISYARVRLVFLAANELVQLGAFAEAREILEHRIQAGNVLGAARNWVAYCQALLQVQAGDLDEAIRLARHIEASTAGQGLAELRARARFIMIHALVELGDTEEAEREALTPGDRHDLPLHERAGVLAGLARIRLLQGRYEEALRLASEALQADRAAAIGHYDTRATCRLAYAEALHASGDVVAASQAIREARDDLLAQADRIEDPTYRHTFLTSVGLHARILSLASDWLGNEVGAHDSDSTAPSR